MASLTQKQLDEIIRTVATLHSQLLAIAEGAPVVPPHIQAIVDDRISKRICLACGQAIRKAIKFAEAWNPLVMPHKGHGSAGN